MFGWCGVQVTDRACKGACQCLAGAVCRSQTQPVKMPVSVWLVRCAGQQGASVCSGGVGALLLRHDPRPVDQRGGTECCRKAGQSISLCGYLCMSGGVCVHECVCQSECVCVCA